MNAMRTQLTFLRRGRRWSIGIASITALYAITGFLILPRILETMIPERAGKALGRPVTLERVRTNPFTLSITIDGFQIKDPDGSALLAWKQLYVNAELWPLLRRRFEFKAINLEQPRLRVVLEKGGRLNFSDILDRLAKDSPARPPQPATQEDGMGAAIGRLRVAHAELAFLDRSLADPFSSTLGPFTIDLDRFRTERDTRSPYAFKGRTEAAEGFAWSGTLGTQPLQSSGTLELTALQLPKYAPYYQSLVAFGLRSGTATLRASYDFEWSEKRHAVNVKDGSLALSDLALREKGLEEPSVLLPSIQVDGIKADLLASSLEIRTVALRDGSLLARREPDGRLNLQTMFTPTAEPSGKKASTLKVHIREVSLANQRIQLEDRVPARPVALSLDRIEGTLKDVTLDPDHISPVELALRIGEDAVFQTRGTIAPLRATGDLAVRLDNLALSPLDPYLDTFADIRLTRGSLGLDGKVHFALEGRKSDEVTYTGSLQIADFEARDSIQNEPFLRWKRLGLAGLEFQSQRPSVALKSVAWTEPEARLVMAKDGGSNVGRALRLTPAGPVASVVPPSAPAGPQPKLRIARMSIARGRLSFIDRSLEPNAALLLSEMEGTYTGLSTEAEEATLADFTGKAGGFAPIRIKGKAMPLRHDKDTDVTVTISGADLTDFSPYTGKYLGYTTRQGKLDVDARIRIQDRKLAIEDKVRLDRMYLGDKVDSPDATRLPVKLGLALLRDRKGVIELEIPVEGSLDEPDIRYGRMVWKAIFNVLGKIITSPFTLLSKMFGSGDEDLSAIVFPAGGTTIGPSEQKKLDTLAKALAERPELSLELEGTTDAADAMVFRQRGLEALLRQTKWNARKVKSPPTPEQEVVDAAEREQWLRAAFDAAFPPPKDAPVEPPPMAEVEQRLLGTIPVDPNDLRGLSDARNRAAIDNLLRDARVDQGRIFMVQGTEAAKAGGPKVYFTLK